MSARIVPLRTIDGQVSPAYLWCKLEMEELEVAKEEVAISAEAVINRSDWGMTYGLENGLVGDEVRLRFGFEAIKDSGWF